MLRRLIRKSKDGLTRLLWRRAGVLLGDGVSFYGGTPRLNVSGALVVGEAVTFKGGRLRSYLDVRHGAELKIGPRTFLNGGVEIQATTSITLGSGCLIGDKVIIQDSNFHEVDEGGVPKVGRVVVGDNVWIARRAIILPGVMIGDHAVVGAGAVVTRDVAARTVVAGSPAIFVRTVRASDAFRR